MAYIPVVNIPDVLKDRQVTHGDYTDSARISQTLKRVISEELIHRMERQQPPLTYIQKESLDMMMLKIGRIIAGESSFADHWIDISGYAEIANK